MSQSENDLLDVKQMAYHLNDSVTTVYLKIRNENLLYKRPDTSHSFYADLKISYRLYVEDDSKTIADSSSYKLIDRSPTENVPGKALITKLNVHAQFLKNYHLELDFLDQNRKTVYRKLLNIYKQNKNSAQNYLVTKNDSVAFRNTFLAGEEVVVKFSDPLLSEVTVECYLHEFGPALPPFSTQPSDPLKYKPDSIFEMELSTNQFRLIMPEKGFYHVKADKKSFDGLTLFSFDESFPGVANNLEMIHATRYIMYKAEFDKCKEAEDKKAAIDNFWLEIGASRERARELLKQYYGRVTEANNRFTSYEEGWKTDRGMIYIVLGPPTSIHQNKTEEVWIYGNEITANVLRFIFVKTQNPYSDNDYILERSGYYKDPYYTAVEYWRQGLIYNADRK